jgi:hypothetical protein
MGRDATDKQQTITDATDAFASCTTADDTITMRTLVGMDEAVCNLRIGIVSDDPVHLDGFAESDSDATASDDA